MSQIIDLIRAALPAGNNLLGSVALDQTNPGTTESVTVKGAGHTAAVTITRPSDTTAYAAGDAIGDTGGSAILEFANVGQAGQCILIMAVDLMVNIASIPSGMSGFTLHLYNATPVAIADNAAWNLVAADRGKYLGSIALASPVDLGDTLYSQNDSSASKQVLLATTSLYGVLVTNTGFTPSSATVKMVRLQTLEV